MSLKDCMLPGLSIRTTSIFIFLWDLNKPFSIIILRVVTSIFPPLKTVPTFVLSVRFILLCIIAATPAAPAPSTSNFWDSKRNNMALAISSSSTSTISSTPFKIHSNTSSFTSRTAIPSAIVLTDFEFWIFFCLKLFIIAFAPFDWTPIILVLGLKDLYALAIPLINPPPPIGTTTISSPSSSIISRAIVPCPAITSVSAKGWMKLRFCSFAIFKASA